ncbi:MULTISPECIES: DUF5819 family protein [unclassified Streptomyces]|uniref:DUF5819 family protein n=1 Tax=unclassified Streptomyces TaxID=2593676 RepID=UPI0035DCFBCD
MDADHGGGSGNEKKIPWPGVASRPPTDRNAAAAPDRMPEAGVDDLRGPVATARPSGTVSTPVLPPVPGGDGRRPGAGMAALSLPYQVVAALALSIVGVMACTHVAMVFLHVAPSNTLTKQHGEVVDRWVYPEFEQNWKLFAPNPLQQNISVHVRADVADNGADGSRITPWMNLSRDDGEAIRGNLLPSHVDQNELRRAWDFYTGSHDSENRPNGLRGELSERYIRRIVMLRLEEHGYGGTVERIQVRSMVRSVGVPPWSEEKVSTRPEYRELPWWTVTPSDLRTADGPAVQSGEAEK